MSIFTGVDAGQLSMCAAAPAVYSNRFIVSQDHEVTRLYFGVEDSQGTLVRVNSAVAISRADAVQLRALLNNLLNQTAEKPAR